MLSKKINENAREIKEIRLIQIKNDESIDDFFLREWLFDYNVNIFYDEKSFQGEEMDCFKTYKNIKINIL